MGLTIHSMAIDTLVPLLRTLSTLLDKGAEHMKAKGANPDALTEARLAPDMFPLTRQVQIACDWRRGRGAPHCEPVSRTPNRRWISSRPDPRSSTTPGRARGGVPGSGDTSVEFPLMNDLVLDMSGEQFL